MTFGPHDPGEIAERQKRDTLPARTTLDDVSPLSPEELAALRDEENDGLDDTWLTEDRAHRKTAVEDVLSQQS